MLVDDVFELEFHHFFMFVVLALVVGLADEIY
jgi:hypothetical protein